MGRRTIPVPEGRDSRTFRFEDDGQAAVGHALVFPRAEAPAFVLRREIEADYVVPAARRSRPGER